MDTTMTDAILEQEIDPEQMTEEQLLSALVEQEMPPAQPVPAWEKPWVPPRRQFHPELIMVFIALFCGVLLAVTVILSLPYMTAAPAPAETIPVQIEHTEPAEEPEEDPESLKHQGAEPDAEPLPTIEPVIEPEANPYGRLDFQYDRNNYLYCLRQESYPGVDVSAFQKNIDWQKVKDSGIRFAMLRLGYRGYESGKLVEDEYIQQNLKQTKEVGMPIGAYFFSQALTIKEVDQEIDFMLKVLGDYELHMPIVLDWEIPTPDARTAKMDARTLTALQEYFCKTMTEKGFTPMVYFNWHQSNTLLYLNELEDYPFWLALYGSRMTYPYHVEMWQYTDSGRVPGIQGGVDLNVYMPKQ